MTTDARAFLTAILANPADNNVRLVYADYLQEQGEDARAEFIRVQVEIATRRWGQRLKGGARPIAELRQREVELLVHASKAKLPWWTPDGLTFWLKAKPVGLALRDQQYLVGLFVRGMIEDVTGSAANWLQHADAILAAHPVRKVTLTTWPTWSNKEETHANPSGGFVDDRWPGIEFELPPEQHRGRVIPVTREAIFNDTGLLARPPG